MARQIRCQRQSDEGARPRGRLSGKRHYYLTHDTNETFLFVRESGERLLNRDAGKVPGAADDRRKSISLLHRY